MNTIVQSTSSKRNFEVGHKLVSLPFMHLAIMPNKTLKLTMNNSNLHADESPASTSLKMTPTVLAWFSVTIRTVFGPGQHRMYGKDASLVQKKHFEAMGFYFSNETLIKEAGKMLGFIFGGHAFHHQFITSLVNEPGISMEESLAVSHHNSVAARVAYITRGSSSELAKFNALGVHGK